MIQSLSASASLLLQDPKTPGFVAPDHTFFTLFQTTGFAGPLMVLLAAIAIVMIVRRSLELRLLQLAPAALQRQLEQAVRDGAFEQAFAAATAVRTMLGDLAVAGLSLRREGLDGMLANVERTAVKEAMRLGNRVANLARMGGVVLIVGALGMVSGLINAMITLTRLKAPTFGDCVLAIAESLSCMAFALAAALLCFGSFFWLDARLSPRVLAVREIAEELMHQADARAHRGGA